MIAGGYNLKNNIMIESPIKPAKRKIQVFLIQAAMPHII
jgi:hypothetical protein